MSIKPDPATEGVAALELSKAKESREQLAAVWPIHMKATEKGVTSALTAGPLLSFPVRFVRHFPLVST